MNQLSERLYVDTGASTPHLRGLLGRLDQLCGETVEITIGDPSGEGFSRTIKLTIEESGEINSNQLDATEIPVSGSTNSTNSSKNVNTSLNTSADTPVDSEDDLEDDDLGEW